MAPPSGVHNITKQEVYMALPSALILLNRVIDGSVQSAEI